MPRSITQCTQLLRTIHVNIVDYLNAVRSGRPVSSVKTVSVDVFQRDRSLTIAEVQQQGRSHPRHAPAAQVGHPVCIEALKCELTRGHVSTGTSRSAWRSARCCSPSSSSRAVGKMQDSGARRRAYLEVQGKRAARIPRARDAQPCSEREDSLSRERGTNNIATKLPILATVSQM